MSFFIHTSETQRGRIESLIIPVLESIDLELYELEIVAQGTEGVLRVLVDCPGGFLQGKGISVGQIVEATREISAMLDMEDPITDPYRLEVFSPGIERNLKHPRHFHSMKGAKIHVVFNRIIEGKSEEDGELLGMKDEIVLLETKKGLIQIPFQAIKSAKTIYEWGKKKGK